MGVLVGLGMSTPLIMATKKQSKAALTRRQRAAGGDTVPLQSVEEGSCARTSGKIAGMQRR